MNPRLFEHYRRELQHAREMGAEFAQEFPKIAGRLGLESLECSDPYVERLLEGFAFMTARVQLKLETTYSKLARHILEMVYPDYLAPTPSMLIAQFVPSMSEGSLEQGYVIERGTRMRSQIGDDEQTECEFRTSHDLSLWPVSVSGIKFLSSRATIEMSGVAPAREIRSALEMELTLREGLSFSELSLDDLSIYLCGSDNTGARLYEQMFAHTKQVAIVADDRELKSPRKPVELVRQGFDDSEALLPVRAANFQGYRLLQEYFTLPERFQFMKVRNLKGRFNQHDGSTIKLVFLFDNVDDVLAEIYSIENFRLHCVPAINLFPKQVDRIHLSRTKHEYHVVPDRTRPVDYEIFSVDDVEGFGTNQADTESFYPYYNVNEKRRTAKSFFNIHREPRELSAAAKRRGPRSSYIGGEIFISLVDANDAPYRTDMRQLAISTLCTNRDLPLQMPVGRHDSDFKLDIGAPVDSIRCVAGPTIPKQSRAHYRDAWLLVSNLSTNYLSLVDPTSESGEASAAMLRQKLELYTDENKGVDRRQLEGILAVKTKPAVRQRMYRGRIEVAHGLDITLTLDESAFQGTGAYLFGSVLERFFARYTTINSFTETTLETIQRNQIERWQVRLGQRHLL